MDHEHQTTSDDKPRSPRPLPRIIGLTGGVGSGKSTVGEYIEKLGFPVYNSDQRAKELVNQSETLHNEIVALLGPEAYDLAGNYDRKYVGKLVFQNERLLKKLNGIIHPAVREDFKNWIRRQESDLVFQETALLFENQLNNYCFKTILVKASHNVRIKRVMDRDGKTYREVERVINNQMSDADKEKLADYIIDNCTDLETLKLHTEESVKSIQEIAGDTRSA